MITMNIETRLFFQLCEHMICCERGCGHLSLLNHIIDCNISECCQNILSFLFIASKFWVEKKKGSSIKLPGEGNISAKLFKSLLVIILLSTPMCQAVDLDSILR